MNQKLVEFIRTQTLIGKTSEEISHTLITQGGWTQEEVQAAYKEAQAGFKEHLQPIVSAPKNQEKVVAPIPSLKPTKKRGLRIRTTIILLALFVLLAAVAAYGYFVYLPNRNQPSLGDALSAIISGTTALSNASYAGSIHATGTFSYVGTENASSSEELSTKVKGTFDVQVPFTFSYVRAGSSTDWQAQISPYGTFSMPPLTLTASATSSLLMASSTLYARLDDISDIAIPFDFSDIVGIWVQVPLTDTTATSSDAVLANAGTLYASSSEAYKNTLTRAISEQAIEVTDTLSGEVVGGKRSYHYRFQVDVGKFSTILSEELRAALPANDSSFATEEIDRDLATLPPLWGELWIDRDSLALRRISLSYQVSTTSPVSSDFVTEFDTYATFVLERVNTVPKVISAPETSVSPTVLMDTVQFNSLLSELGDASTSTEAVARRLWTARSLLEKSYPSFATSSRSWRRYPTQACKILGTSTSCRIGPASSAGNTFVLWANVSGKRILCVDSTSSMVLLTKSLKATEYRCPIAVSL